MASNPSGQVLEGGASQEPDDLSLPRLAVPYEHFAACPQLLFDELIQRDRPVGYVRLGQARPFLKPLKILGGLRYQGNGDSLSNRRLSTSITVSCGGRKRPGRESMEPRMSERLTSSFGLPTLRIGVRLASRPPRCQKPHPSPQRTSPIKGL